MRRLILLAAHFVALPLAAQAQREVFFIVRDSFPDSMAVGAVRLMPSDTGPRGIAIRRSAISPELVQMMLRNLTAAERRSARRPGETVVSYVWRHTRLGPVAPERLAALERIAERLRAAPSFQRVVLEVPIETPIAMPDP